MKKVKTESIFSKRNRGTFITARQKEIVNKNFVFYQDEKTGLWFHYPCDCNFVIRTRGYKSKFLAEESAWEDWVRHAIGAGYAKIYRADDPTRSTM